MALDGKGATGELSPNRCASAMMESAPSFIQSCTATGFRERLMASRSVTLPRNSSSEFFGRYDCRSYRISMAVSGTMAFAGIESMIARA